MIIALAAVGVPVLSVTWAVVRWGNRVGNLLQRHDERIDNHEDRVTTLEGKNEERLAALEQVVERRKLHLNLGGNP